MKLILLFNENLAVFADWIFIVRTTTENMKVRKEFKMKSAKNLQNFDAVCAKDNLTVDTVCLTISAQL